MSESPESSPPGSAFGWPIVAALAITAAIVVDRARPFIHSRPQQDAAIDKDAKTDARLWHDPIAPPERTRTAEFEWQSNINNVLLVMVPAGSRRQRSEYRCNTRHALHTAASSCGFSPSKPQVQVLLRLPKLPTYTTSLWAALPNWYRHLKPASKAAGTATPAVATQTKAKAASKDSANEFVVEPFANEQKPETTLAIWLPENEQSVENARLLRRYLDRLAGEKTLTWTVVGPSSSEEISKVQELWKTPATSGDKSPWKIPHTRYFSPWATTEDSTERPFRSFTCPDKELARRLVGELALRNVNTADEVLLVLERDSLYARRWIEHLEAAWGCDNLGERTIYYSRGIDGERPSRARSDSSGKQNDQRASIEDPHGLATADYFRRLRNRIAADESFAGVKAVGIIGDDIHDKLLVLQALRPALESAVYFSSDLDAYYLDPDEQPHARNLIVVAGHDLTPQQFPRVAPFRNSYQTSAFQAFHAALPRPSNEQLAKANQLPPPPPGSVFEIGITAPVNLGDGVKAKELLKTLGALVAVFVLGWFAHKLLQSPEDNGKRRWPGMRTRRGAHLLVMAIAAVTLIPCATSSEPVTWTQGVSVWPTIAFRILAIELALVFGLKVVRTIQTTIRSLRTKPRNSLLTALMTGIQPRLARKFRLFGSSAQRTRTITWHALLLGLSLATAGMIAVLTFEWTPPPTRGRVAHCWDCSLKFLAVTALLWLVALVVQFTRLHSARCDELRARIPDLVAKDKFTARIDELASSGGKGIYGPFFVVLALSLGRADWFDRWGWPTASIILLVTCTLAIIVAHVFLHRSAKKLQDAGLDYIREQIVQKEVPPPRLLFKHEQLTRMRHGILAGPTNHPILVALLIPFSGMGGLSLIHMMQSPPF